MQEGRNAVRQTDRQRYRKTYVQLYIQTNRNKDVQTYTDKQKYRQCNVRVQAEKQIDVQKDQYSHILYIPTVLCIRQTDRQTD